MTEQTGTNTGEDVETNPAEERARADGWVPQDEWKGEPDKWVEANEFNLRGEFMTRISEQSGIINHQKNKLGDMEKSINDLKKLQSKIEETAYAEALRDLKAKKVEALEASDHATVVDVDEAISDIKNKKKELETAATETQTKDNDNYIPPEIEQWMADPSNAWYHSDPFMRSVADGFGAALMQENPNILPSTLIRQVEASMRKELPHKFKRNTQSDVSDGGDYSGANNSRRNSTPTFNDLTDEQKQVAIRFEKSGVMKRGEYIKSLQKIGEL